LRPLRVQGVSVGQHRRMKLKSFVIATVLTSGTLVQQGSAQIIFGWDTNGLASYGSSPFAPTTSNSNLIVGGLTRGSGVTTPGGAATSVWGGAGFDQTTSSAAIAANDVITFSVQPSAGYSYSLSTLNANFRRSSSGPADFLWQYSTNGTTFADIGSPFSYTGTATNGEAQSSITLSGIAALQDVINDTPVIFRLVAWSGSTGNFGFGRLSGDDLTFAGTVGAVSAIPEPSTYAAIGGSIALAAAWYRRRMRNAGAISTAALALLVPVRHEQAIRDF
jgi:hypothetical protein